MLSLISVALLGLSAVLVYRKRFTSEKRIGGMYFVQLYYLILAPVVCALLINAGLEIYSRQTVQNLPLASNLIFLLYVGSIIAAGIGTGIHSTSTSVYQSLIKEKQTRLVSYHINEIFHISLSHNLLFMGVIIGTVLLAFLEINHPSLKESVVLNAGSVIAFGIALGLIEAIGVLRSANSKFSSHISYSLVGSLIGSLVIFYFIRPFMLSVDAYPIAFICLSSLLTLFLTLTASLLSFILSGRLSKRIIKRTFPKGHPFHEGISVKVLKIKIERDWL